jgi:hypothetical protein
MKYISKGLNAHLLKLEAQARHYYFIASRMRRKCDRLPKWFTDHTVEYYEGALMATYGAIDTLLTGKYNGFRELTGLIDEAGHPVSGDGLRAYIFAVKPVAKQVEGV